VAAFLVLLSVPLAVGVIGQYPVNDVLRDVIPLLYFFLPLLVIRDSKKALLYGLLAVGVFYSLRFWPASGLTLARLGLDRGDDEMLYLSSSPAISFAGLYLFFMAAAPQEKPLWHRAAFLFLSATCLLTLVAILQRGALLLVLTVLWFYGLSRLKKSPAFLVFSLAVVLVFGFAFAETIIGTLETIWRKTLLVGDNARFAELASVRDHLDRNPLQWLTGAGWGATLTTAASGHAKVRYTHMLIGYVLLKGGIAGLGALIAYMATLLRNLRHTDPLIVASAAPSLILGLTLYPSFKMLCFGALLALVAPFSWEKNEHQGKSPVYQPRVSA
jgi:hypothetical protein